MLQNSFSYSLSGALGLYVKVSITAKLSGKKTAADIDGNFTIEVEQGDTITIKFIGMQDRIIKLSEMNLEKLNVITLTESGGLTGEIVVVKKGHKHKRK